MMIITIDGPAGVGKSTLASTLAEKLGMPFLDTGAMFRQIALIGGEKLLDGERDIAETLNLHFSLSGSGWNTVLSCNGSPISQEIRTEKIGNLASRLAARPDIREILLNAQRDLGGRQSMVVEGRDMGTVVFPNAKYKFFLEADPEIRAMRRFRQLEQMGKHPDLKELETQIRLRDQQDRNRAIAPLKAANDAMIIDTSKMGIDQVLEKMLAHIREIQK